MLAALVVASAAVLAFVPREGHRTPKHPRAQFGRVEAGAGVLLNEGASFGGGGAVAYEFRPIPWFGAGPKYSIFAGGGGFIGHLIGPEFRVYPLPFVKRGDWQLNAAPGVALVPSSGDVSVSPYVRVGTGFEFRAGPWARIGPAVEFANLFVAGADVRALGLGITAQFGGPIKRRRPKRARRARSLSPGPRSSMRHDRWTVD